jgi:hypothetical protein
VAVLPARVPTPSLIVCELLDSHPEAASLLYEAGHCETLAALSVVTVGRAFSGEQAARVRYEQLRHRLDPRRRRPMHFGFGLGLLAALAAGLVVLDHIELGRAVTGTLAIPAAIAAAAVWLAGAWLAAVASREGRSALVAVLAAGGAGLTLILTVLHGLTAPTGRPGSVVGLVAVGVGGLVGAFLAALAAGAFALIARMEPTSVFLARRRWLRAQAEHEATVRQEQADAEAASVAREAWLGLVRARAATASGEAGRDLVPGTVALASALLPDRQLRPRP